MRYLLPFLILFLATAAYGQFDGRSKGVPAPAGTRYTTDDISLRTIPESFLLPGSGATSPAAGAAARHLLRTAPGLLVPRHPGLEIIRDKASGLPVFISGEVSLPALELRGQPAEVQPAYAYLEALKKELRIETPVEEFEVLRVDADQLGYQHVRLQQVYQGVKVYGSELIVHTRQGQPFVLNGRHYPTPVIERMEPALDRAAAQELAMADIARHTTVRALSPQERQLLSGPPVEADLVIYFPEAQEASAVLAWQLTIVPHLGERWSYLLDAGTGAVLQKYSHVCRFLPEAGSFVHSRPAGHHPAAPAIRTLSQELPANGPRTASGVDLLGINRSIETYELQGEFLLLDASRSMYNASRSRLPQEPVGAIVTLDAQDTSPEREDFSAGYISSPDNSWDDPKAVSAHVNAGTAYEYFRTTFNRNSINGQGGTIYSIINVTEGNGDQMDNAFWDGRAMYYGNGKEAFTPLAKSLDVAGHEMSHGVVQSTANLEYRGESGALNESFADIFGVLIDRDDWQLGEEVVNLAYYPSGALRDMSNPNNGGFRLGDPGWQPAHTDEQYFGEQDNGGVHINSGIPNRAFYLFASEVGLEVAEQVYYRALSSYLVRSSRFIDLRAAVLQAADDLHGEDPSVAAAADEALAAVGIVGDASGDYQQDVEENEGTEYILVTNGNRTNINIVTPGGDIIANPLIDEEPLWKPSVTDDGSLVIYVGADKHLKYIQIDWQNNSFSQGVLSTSAIWRSAAVSRDGSKIAALTDAQDNQMVVFDLINETNEFFELYNPTFTSGVQTGTVNYAEAMEWDFTGEYVMYDANNSIGSGLDQSDYWDISFIQVWDNDRNRFVDPSKEGIISKLINDLPDNTSVGNPTFSKNSPYIVAFDLLDDATGETFVLGGNIQTGEVGVIAETGTLGYPSFSIDDSRVIIDELTGQGDPGLAIVDLDEAKIQGRSSPRFLFTGASWANWFAIGERVLTSTGEPAAINGMPIKVFPNPFLENLTIEFELERSEKVMVELFDLLGRRMYLQTFDAAAGNFRQPLSIGGLPAGSYLLRVNAGADSATQRIMKAR